jgi:hypothetical protein
MRFGPACFARLALLCLLGVGLCACEAADSPTEVLVVVDDGDFATGELTQLEIRELSASGDVTAATPIDKVDENPGFPLSFLLTPMEGATRFRIAVVGLGPSSASGPLVPLVEQRASGTFQRRQRLLLSITLTRACREVVCTTADGMPAQTCNRGECVVEERELDPAGPGALGGYRPTDEQSSPANADAGEPAAGRLDGGRDATVDLDAGSIDASTGPADPDAGELFECSRNEECQPRVANAVPAGCAIARCVAGKCQFSAADTDKDMVPTQNCVAPEVTLSPGSDCNDQSAEQKPGNWDGPPKNASDLGSCDGVDNDCSGKADDGVFAGKSCDCDPAVDKDVDCSELSDGKAIVWPKGVPVGSCSYGKRSCKDGMWTPCIGAKTPAAADLCDKPNDDANCDGATNAGCTCVNGTTQQCGTDRGPCELGVQTCVDNKWSTTCVGGVAPAAKDSCVKGDDSNCSGTAMDGCECETGKVSTCSKIEPLASFGDCPQAAVTCVAGRWDVAPCLQKCDQCKAEGLLLCSNGVCKDKFNDFQCECNTGYTTDATGRACVATPCSPNPCGAGTCLPSGSTFSCKCNAGYEFKATTGKCEKIPQCKAGACANGSCVEGATDWSCTCNPGFSGTGTKSCVAESHCPPGACVGGSCVSDPVGFHCECPAGTMLNPAGTGCEPAGDSCLGVICELGGTCTASPGGKAQCSCPATNTTTSPNGKKCVCVEGQAACAGICIPVVAKPSCDACMPSCGPDLACIVQCAVEAI